MTAVLTAMGVSREFAGRRVVDNVSVSLSAGRVTALLGQSGCGKSTLLRMLAGLEPVDGGEIRNERDVLSSPGQTVSPDKRNVGLVFQSFALFSHLTARDNVAFGLAHEKREQRNRIAQQLLADAGLADRASAYPFQLSGGEQQRVAIARALARKPSAVLLDEPFSSLDAGLRRQTRQRALAQLRQASTAVLLVTHDADEALSEADDIAVMKSGQVIDAGPPERVYATPATLESAQLTGDVNQLVGAVSGARVLTALGELPAVSDGYALVRPEALLVRAASSPGAPATVVDRRQLAGALEITVELSSPGRPPEQSALRVRCPLNSPWLSGQTVSISHLNATDRQ
ncbi:MAG: ABC transporter ATP-binding protein [Pseudomonadaceae bacterium]|nr:ABC transporter ATP-binding protein [Pseudomonadaceae bacterium]